MEQTLRQSAQSPHLLSACWEAPESCWKQRLSMSAFGPISCDLAKVSEFACENYAMLNVFLIPQVEYLAFFTKSVFLYVNT